MGTTPTFTLPYVEPTDTLATYPAAMKANAEAVEAALTGTGAAYGWARQTATQTIPNAVATALASLTLDASSSGVTLVGTQLRAPTAGVYLITASVQFLNSATGARSMFLRKNTVTLIRFTGLPSATQPALPGSIAAVLAAGDLIDVQAYQSSGAALGTDFSANATGFTLTRL